MIKIYSVVYDEGYGENVEDFDTMIDANECYERVVKSAKYAMLRDVEYSDDYSYEKIIVVKTFNV